MRHKSDIFWILSISAISKHLPLAILCQNTPSLLSRSPWLNDSLAFRFVEQSHLFIVPSPHPPSRLLTISFEIVIDISTDSMKTLFVHRLLFPPHVRLRFLIAALERWARYFSYANYSRIQFFLIFSLFLDCQPHCAQYFGEEPQEWHQEDA